MIPVMRYPPFVQGLLRFPWRRAFFTLRERFREDRLGMSASSLTFTTSIALVPFFTVVLAVFTVFPAFAKMQGLLQTWLIESLVPDHMTRQVMGYLTQFTRQASRLGVVGLAVLVFTASALVLTIDRTLNAIWRVPRSRPLAQRLLVYWAAVTAAPLVLAASLAATAQALVFLGWGKTGSGLMAQLLETLEFFLHAAVLAALFRFMPNTRVRWAHAWAGALFAAAGLVLAKTLLALYLRAVPTYSLVYGAFATVPILLMWIYLAWIIVLLGAVISAYLPSLVSGQLGRHGGPGSSFELSLAVLRQLLAWRGRKPQGCSTHQLAADLQADPFTLEPVLQQLRHIGWIAPAELEPGGEPRWILLADPEREILAPLVETFLVVRSAHTERLWQESRWSSTRLRSVL